MNGTLSIAQVRGIDIKVHFSFVLILALGAWQWGSSHGGTGAVFGMLLMLLLFACVALHELGHSLVAQRFNIKVKEIVLLPIGGVARLQGRPATPKEELLIALAGPLVNVVLALLLLIPAKLAVPWDALQTRPLVTVMTPSLSTALLWLLSANVTLAVFNMIPALPLDGGRVLRAALEMGMGHERATSVASLVGQVLAFGMGIYGMVSGNFILALIALMVFTGAGQERVEASARTVLSTLRVGDAYNKHALTLGPGDRLSRVVDFILTSYQPDFAVMQGDAPVGIVTRATVLQALGESEEDPYVAGIMDREMVRVDAGLSLDAVRQAMAEKEIRVVAVFDGERYLGLVSAEDIAEAHLVGSVLRGRQQDGEGG